MDEWENSNDTSLHEKEDFYSNLNKEEIQIEITCIQKDVVKTLS